MATRTVERIVFEVSEPGAQGAASVLLIHGLGGDSNTWSPVLSALPPMGTVRLDLPGSGRSPLPATTLSIAGYVDAALKVARASGLERFHLAGHSMGAIVALHLAAREPKRVVSLALLGPLLAPPDIARAGIRSRGQKARAERQAGMQDIADALCLSVTAAQTRANKPVVMAFVRESLMRQDPDGYAASCEALAAAQPAEFSALSCPALLITGDEDPVAPPQMTQMLAQRLRDAGARVQFEVLRGCGHWTPIEMPEACADLMRRFYSQRFAPMSGRAALV